MGMDEVSFMNEGLTRGVIIDLFMFGWLLRSRFGFVCTIVRRWLFGLKQSLTACEYCRMRTPVLLSLISEGSLASEFYFAGCIRDGVSSSDRLSMNDSRTINAVISRELLGWTVVVSGFRPCIFMIDSL